MSSNLIIKSMLWGLVTGSLWGVEEWLYLWFADEQLVFLARIVGTGGLAFFLYGCLGAIISVVLASILYRSARVLSREEDSALLLRVIVTGVMAMFVIAWVVSQNHSELDVSWSGILVAGIFVSIGWGAFVSFADKNSQRVLAHPGICSVIISLHLGAYSSFFLVGLIRELLGATGWLLSCVIAVIIWVGIALLLRAVLAQVTKVNIRFLVVVLWVISGIVPLLVSGLSKWNDGPVLSNSKIADEKSEEGIDRPNILMIVVDTLRADHLGAYGYPRQTSPNIDSLAEQGVQFDAAYATSSWTAPSTFSLMTSRYPKDHGVRRYPHILSDTQVTMPDILRENGYMTLGFIANPILNSESGIQYGFDELWDSDALQNWTLRSFLRPLAIGEIIHRQFGLEQQTYLVAPEVTRAVVSRMAQGLREPWFLYVHYMDPHMPFSIHTTYRGLWSNDTTSSLAPVTNFTKKQLHDITATRKSPGREDIQYLFDLYDEEVRLTDDAIGHLVQSVQSHVKNKDISIVLTSDHGEEFWEHGAYEHARTLFREVTHVPLIWSGYGVGEPGRHVEGPISLIDVAPTLLDLAGVELSPRMNGISWGNVLSYSQGSDSSAVESGSHEYGAWSELDIAQWSRALRKDQWSSIWFRAKVPSDSKNISHNLFFLPDDPLEKNDVSAAHPEITAEFASSFRQYVKSRDDSGVKRSNLGKANSERLRVLRALGYLD